MGPKIFKNNFFEIEFLIKRMNLKTIFSRARAPPSPRCAPPRPFPTGATTTTQFRAEASSGSELRSVVGVPRWPGRCRRRRSTPGWRWCQRSNKFTWLWPGFEPMNVPLNSPLCANHSNTCSSKQDIDKGQWLWLSWSSSRSKHQRSAVPMQSSVKIYTEPVGLLTFERRI